jgi:hypothetical protein
MAFKINRIKSAILAVTISTAAGAIAQGMPPALRSLMDDNRSDAHVIYVDKITDEQRAFFNKTAKNHPDGYRERLEKEVSGVQIIDSFLQRKDAGPEKKPSIFSSIVNTERLRNMQYLGEFREGKNRTSLFFKDASSALIMLTITDLVASGYKIWVIREHLRAEVNGNKATLSLSIHEPTKQALWSAGWVSGNHQFELLIKDTVDANRRPTKRPQEIIDIAQQIVRNAVGASAK